jgi:RecA-family ATPase
MTAADPPVTAADREAALAKRMNGDGEKLAADERKPPRERSALAAAGIANFRRLAAEDAARKKGALATTATRSWVTAVEIEKTEIKVPKFAVEGLLPTGLSILAGRPKIGKSWLALHIADAISRGIPALGNIPTERGPVLYMALEDTVRRLQQRLRAVRQGEEPGVDLALATAWPRMDGDGLNKLEDELTRYTWKAIIIDTFQKIRPEQDSRASVYGNDYAAVQEIKALADRYETAILLLHHLRKGTSNDPVEEISGSTGLTGAVDTIWVLKRDRTQADGVLFVTGRDVEEQEIALQFDKATGLWTALGNAEEYRTTEERRAIRKALQEAGQPLTARQVAIELDKSYEAIRKTLQRMAADGTVAKKGLGKYAYL